MSTQLGLPLTVREKELGELQFIEPPRTKDIRFQSKLTVFRVGRIRIELPKYRLENGRTSAAQRDYIAKQKLDADFFNPSRSENDDVQIAQHEILKRMADNADADRNLFKFFVTHEQDDPLILDSNGFVVNGNRRLCAMRELLSQDASKYKKFSHIDVILLPTCAPKDVDELEAVLQVEKDIKEDYSWINFAYSVRQKLNTNQYTEEQLCEIYNITPKEFKSLLNRLDQAEDYLVSRNKSGQYLELDKAQLAFEQLQKSRPKLESRAKKDFYTEVAYQIIETASGDRAYASIPDALEVIEDIRKELETDLLKEEIKAERESLAAARTDELFGANTVDSDYTAAFKALRKAEDKPAVRAIIQNAIESKRERDKVAKRSNSALIRIRDANTALVDATAALPMQASKEGISEQLDSIEKSIKFIRTWLTTGKING
jgi:hypothetical protein